MKTYLYFEYGDVILHPTQPWQHALFGEQWAKGDTIFLTAIIALVKGDKKLLNKCIELLNQRRRWGESLDDIQHDAPSLFIEYVDTFLTRYNRWASRKDWRPIIPWRKRYRCVKGMTRDPFVMTYIAWFVLYGEGECPLNHPFWINRPDFYYFAKWIKTGKSKYKKRYEWWMTFSLRHKKKLPGYVLHLHLWKAAIIESDKIKELLRSFVPHWHLLGYILSDHPLLYLYTDAINNYISRTDYHWDRDKYCAIGKDGVEELSEDSLYRPDREILDWAMIKFYKP